MRLRNVRNAKEIINNSTYMILEPEKNKGNWSNIFNNNNPIHIEIGMGKGKFILENALKYPNINFIGIEKYDSVMVKSLKKINEYNLSNLKLIRIDALNINNIFDHEIDRLYLNFSDPWPKDRHVKRRLTSDIFLNLYENIFKNKKEIYMKTDNENLYLYSKEQFLKHNYEKKTYQYNIDNVPENNIMTEYEEKFILNNKIIYKIEAVK